MKNNRKWLNFIMAALMLVSMVFVAKEAADYVTSQRMAEFDPNLVVIDAGHGAKDAGKVGINQALEKDINLAIALRLKELLENDGVTVIMTREDDQGTYPKTGDNRKIRDMQKRVELINNANPALTVSVHQNSYSDESVHGAQTFYFTGSAEGRIAAEMIQRWLVYSLDPENHRQAKENSSYYLLKNVTNPIVIAECGFLSNSKEAELLCDEEYQKKVAWALHLGIKSYLNSIQESGNKH